MTINIIRNLLVVSSLLFIAFISLRNKQNKKLNWAIFYSTLYTSISLVIFNLLCLDLNYWVFTDISINIINIPFDIYFIWIVSWGVIPVFFLQKRYFLLIILILFWVDFLLMPKLEEFGLIVLNENWLVGEFILIFTVFIPSYIWAYCSYFNLFTGLRAIFQIVIMGCVFIFGLPFLFKSYGVIDSLNYEWSIIEFQIILIIAFPSLSAVYDLVTKGNGTPFPYDSTNKLVVTGVYAYCRNPIQWSFTLIFIPLSVYHSSYIFLIGSIVSIAYVIGISDYQEYPDMEKRFGKKWIDYKNNVPKWYFSWKPKNSPLGKIYFDTNCSQCNQLKKWFGKFNLQSLEIMASTEFAYKEILQVTYIDHSGREFKGVNAIASGFNHINLAYATLGWFIKFPLISHLLQIIVYSMFSEEKETCELN